MLTPQAAASRPQQALAYAIRGAVLAAQGKATDAAAADAEAAKLDPASPEIPHLVGQRKLREGDAAGAVEALQRAVSIDPKRVSLYADLVRAQLAREGGAKQALETLKRAVAFVARARASRAPRRRVPGGRRRGPRARAREGHPARPPFPDARVALAELHRAKDNVPGALVELTQAIDEYGQGGAGGAASRYVEMAEASGAPAARTASCSRTCRRRRSSAIRRAATRCGAPASSRPTSSGRTAPSSGSGRTRGSARAARTRARRRRAGGGVAEEAMRKSAQARSRSVSGGPENACYEWCNTGGAPCPR